MEKNRQRTKDDEKQSKRFIEAAREAEADESEKGADKAFKRVAPMKPAKSARGQER